jgi:hypothetical protein
LDDALPDLERIRRRYRIYFGLPPSNRRKLQGLLDRAYKQLDHSERQLIGTDLPLHDLDGWSACRFVMLLICRGATYDSEHAERTGTDAAEDDDSWEAIERALSRDRRPTLDVLHRLMSSTDVPFICRDYTRVAVHLFAACRSASRAIADSFLLPIQGWHDLRSAVGHAWCLYVDRSRHVAVPLDPTSADALWEHGADSPFNSMLDGRGLSTASVLLSRLVEERSPVAARAGAQMMRGLPQEQRAMLAARLLAQNLVALDLSLQELEHLWRAATEQGAPSALAVECLARVQEEDDRQGDDGGEEEQEDEAELAHRRGRCAALLCAGGLVQEHELPETMKADLEHHRAAVRAAQARAAGVGRNDPCPCGSGAKYKRCCGR